MMLTLQKTKSMLCFVQEKPKIQKGYSKLLIENKLTMPRQKKKDKKKNPNQLYKI